MMILQIFLVWIWKNIFIYRKENWIYFLEGTLSGVFICREKVGIGRCQRDAFYHYALFLQKLQPKMFLFENVRGLLTHNHGNTYKTMLSIFAKAGYTIDKKVLNAWDYGVPQKRERLITVGIRNDLVDKTEYVFPKPHDYKPVLKDVLLDCPDSPYIPYGEKKKRYLKWFRQVDTGETLIQMWQKEYMKSCWEMEGGRTGILRRMSLDEPSLTVLTSPSQKQTERCHPLEARPFTIRKMQGVRLFQMNGNFVEMFHLSINRWETQCQLIWHGILQQKYIVHLRYWQKKRKSGRQCNRNELVVGFYIGRKFY